MARYERLCDLIDVIKRMKMILGWRNGGTAVRRIARDEYGACLLILNISKMKFVRLFK